MIIFESNSSYYHSVTRKNVKIIFPSCYKKTPKYSTKRMNSNKKPLPVQIYSVQPKYAVGRRQNIPEQFKRWLSVIYETNYLIHRSFFDLTAGYQLPLRTNLCEIEVFRLIHKKLNIIFKKNCLHIDT